MQPLNFLRAVCRLLIDKQKHQERQLAQTVPSWGKGAE
ncbi:hypothetical protein EHF_0236 [Ehrlichia japonica]|uniref:Uncharacterized protein n=1 Tax=Ehrlichia japonica TaxID=391036 RepID=X5GKX1_9RICK|nr:hypothetical protein EHF_0236 [Ehrlichia japonica]